eukprot:5358658-Pyramimonas_sp.AAC.1
MVPAAQGRARGIMPRACRGQLARRALRLPACQRAAGQDVPGRPCVEAPRPPAEVMEQPVALTRRLAQQRFLRPRGPLCQRRR